jgi:hypothetical protein
LAAAAAAAAADEGLRGDFGVIRPPWSKVSAGWKGCSVILPEDPEWFVIFGGDLLRVLPRRLVVVVRGAPDDVLECVDATEDGRFANVGEGLGCSSSVLIAGSGDIRFAPSSTGFTPSAASAMMIDV